MVVKKQEAFAPDAAKTAKTKSCIHGLQLVIVQSSICLAVIAVAFLLKAIGGDVFADLSTRFCDAMLDQTVVHATAQAVPQAVVAQQSQDTVAVATAPQIVPPVTGGVLTSPFGERQDPFDTSVRSFHQGMDIAVPGGTPLAAMKSGVVEEVGYEENGYGHYVIVKTDDIHQYVYAHCLSVSVVAGQSVTAGETIAAVGTTGRSTGNHVHLEWRENGVPLDPAAVVPKSAYA